MYLDLKNSSQKKICFSRRSFLALGFICIGALNSTAYADHTPEDIFKQNQSSSLSTPQPTHSALTKKPSHSEKDLKIIRHVIQSGLTFMTPRLLSPHTAEELTLWGLNAFLSHDPDLSITEITSEPFSDNKKAAVPLNKTTLHKFIVLKGNKLIADVNFPSEQDYQGWAELAVTIIQKEWEEIPLFKSENKDHILALFFSEICHHLDPYSRYLTPEQAQNEREKRQGTKYSLGLTLQKEPGHYPVIDTINPNSLIWAEGADHGQKIYKINDHKTARPSLETITSWTVKDKPKTVTVKYGRSYKRARSAKISLERLAPQTASIVHYTNHFLLLRVTDFSTQTADEISQLLSDSLPLKGVILDLRGNKGGVLQQAVMTAALFLDHGMIATTMGRNPAANHVWAVQGGDITENAPLTVLVDDHTASAAEVLAAALADHHRAVIIGSTTYGKGLVQDIGQMPNGGEIFVTWSRNTAPLGEPIQVLGVVPQICTSSNHPTLNEQIFSLKQGHSLLADLVAQSRSANDKTPPDELEKIRAKCPPSHVGREGLTTALHVLISPEIYQTALETIPSLSDTTP